MGTLSRVLLMGVCYNSASYICAIVHRRFVGAISESRRSGIGRDFYRTKIPIAFPVRSVDLSTRLIPPTARTTHAACFGSLDRALQVYFSNGLLILDIKERLMSKESAKRLLPEKPSFQEKTGFTRMVLT